MRNLSDNSVSGERQAGSEEKEVQMTTTTSGVLQYIVLQEGEGIEVTREEENLSLLDESRVFSLNNFEMQ